jgi:hypothetical protein
MRILVAVLLLSLSAHADAPAPTLTDAQKAQLTIAILTRDNAQLRLDALVKELSRDGYDLTAAGDYVKKAEATP